MATIKSISRRHLPSRFLAGAVIITAIALMWFAFSDYQSFQGSSTMQAKFMRLEKLGSRVIHFDEAFTMSARMAAETGDPNWKKRYLVFEKKYLSMIKELKKLAPEAMASITQTDESGQKLALMEHRVFKLAGLNRLNEAQGILASEEYRRQVRIHVHGMEQLLEQLQSISQREHQLDRQRNFQQLVLEFCGIAIFFVGWLLALRAMQRDQVALMEFRVQLESKVNALAELNATLDQKVAQRTGDSEAARIAALNMMEDATESREKAVALNGELLQQITERKQAETALRQGEERYRSLAVATSQIVWTTPPDGAVEDMPAWRNYTGQSVEEVQGWGWGQALHPDDRERAEKIWVNCVATKSLYETEYRIRAADGEYRLFAVRGVPILESDASIREWVGTCTDITELKEAEAALRKANENLELRVAERTSELERANVALREEEAEQQQIMATLTQSEERFRLLVENAHDYAILMLSPTGHIMTWNAGAERMKGYRAEDIIGQHFSCFYTEEDQQAGKPMQMLRTAEAEGYLEDEGWRVRQDGSRFWATLVLTALRDESGNLRGFAKVSRDITERKNIEAALHEAKAQADAANLAKSEFLSRMSHELRTPLNAILGFGQILDKENLDPLAHESVGFILKGGRHLLDLINEILDIARVEAGHVDLSIEPIALADVVPEVCALVRPLAAGRNIRFSENTSKTERLYVLADLQRFKQVLINLLSNAIKYNRESGEVEVSCEQQPDEWISIAIRDTGPGITPEDLPKLFTPFERLSASTSNVEGTGLGLVLSQRLVTAMGGTLKVESTLGEGTTFTVAFPQAVSPVEQLKNLPEGTLQVETIKENESSYSILCIEDNPSNLRLIEAILRSRPEITLLAAIQGSVGLDLARQHEPDLILLDLDLPDIHGTEVLARLQQSALTRDIPVVIVSADATTKQIERLLAAGAKDYLTKPLNVDQFLHTLDKFLAEAPVI